MFKNFGTFSLGKNGENVFIDLLEDKRIYVVAIISKISIKLWI